MAFKITGKIEGLAEVLAALDEVDAKIRKKAIKKAVGEAGKIVLRAAKSKARKKTGLLRQSLGRKVQVYRTSGVAVAIVGPRTGYKTVGKGASKRKVITALGQKFKDAGVNPVKYAHLVELGTSHSQPFPFLRPALEGNEAQIKAAMADAIQSVLGAL